MIQKDLEYHIKYPSTTRIESNLNGENNESVLVCDKGKIPVVILCGWTICRDKHLAKYSSIYEDLGYITVRCRLALLILTLRHDKLPRLAREFLDFLRERSLDQHPIIFHNFSNGGTFFYQYVSFEMQKQNKILQIKGMIFDSAPGRTRLSSLYHAAVPSVGGPVWYNVPVSFSIALILMAYFILWPIFEALFEIKMPRTESIVLDDEPYTWPQLFIYSKSDKLTTCEDIESFAQQREEKGIKVTRLCLENSPHVQHLNTHREIYMNTVVNFVQSCFNGKNKMQSWL